MSTPGCRNASVSCPTLCDPVDCSPPGSAVPGILQARILQGVGISSSRGSGERDRTPVDGFFGEGNGKPLQYSCLENLMDGGAW